MNSTTVRTSAAVNINLESNGFLNALMLLRQILQLIDDSASVVEYFKELNILLLLKVDRSLADRIDSKSVAMSLQNSN
ncbi:hypothetical protein MED92_11119 [Oceanospirillum sp. MED92]|uniref:Uncharacterized protein n=1 Tax=Neptuniibacter caesariensis TaxID=207954 RepID=A0A7U8GSF4_NEPCE|nr:hypothetical protein MED92_11119 [Oceanospirillum sp. MED92] [Neptuniibacter caesariensis]